MRIAGKWHACDDGVVRPMLIIDVISSNAPVDEMFLVDPGADRTVLGAGLLNKLGGATMPAPSGVSLAGIGGTQPFVQVQATLHLRRTDGGIATVQASFSAFTDPAATDFSILGRDVLDYFDVILSRRRDELLLLAPPLAMRFISMNQNQLPLTPTPQNRPLPLVDFGVRAIGELF